MIIRDKFCSAHLDPNTSKWAVGYCRQSHNPWLRIPNNLSTAFLPEGFPDSVPADYLAFQAWDSVQALCSYVRGVLSSNALLTGVGVGTSTATALSATATFVFKDLTGMVGSIAFSYAQGAKLDADEKQWRYATRVVGPAQKRRHQSYLHSLFADAMNNVGLALELASPSFPSAFLLLACLGSIARAITGVAGAATRAAMTQHFARGRHNAADIAAKECSQETATVLLGMLIGLLVARLADGRPLVAWITFVLLMVLHMGANVRAVRCLELSSINRTRADILLRDFVSSKGMSIPSPKSVAAREPLLPPPMSRLVSTITGAVWHRQYHHIRFGVGLLSLQGATAVKASGRRSTRQSGQGVMQPYVLARRGGTVLVVLEEGVCGTPLLQAYCHARLVADGLEERVPWLLQHWESMLQQVQAAGWELDRLHLAPGEHRCHRRNKGD